MLVSLDLPPPAPPPSSEFNAVDVRSPPPKPSDSVRGTLEDTKLEAWERRASQSRPAAPAPPPSSEFNAVDVRSPPPKPLTL